MSLTRAFIACRDAAGGLIGIPIDQYAPLHARDPEGGAQAGRRLF